MHHKIANFSVLFLLLMSIWLSSCLPTDQPNDQTAKTFPTFQPILIDTVQYNNYVSSIQSLKNVEIRARVKGYIEEIYVDEGDKVKKGDILFRINEQEYRMEVARAKAQLKNAIAEAKAAELNLENVRKLLSQKIVSQTEEAMAIAKVDALKAKIEEAESYEKTTELRLSYTLIKAPFDGVIDRIPNKIGSLIDEGTLLTSISDNQSMYAYFNISEKEYLDLDIKVQGEEKTNDVALILANNREHKYKGRIETVEGEFDNETGSIAFRAIFPNPDNILRHGASGKVRIRKNLKNVLVIPQKSAFEIQDKIYVFVINKDGTARMQNFTPKLRIPHLYIVDTGLSMNDQIVYEGIQEVREGMLIKPEKIDLKQIIRNFSEN